MAREAIDRHRENHYDLILMDWHMPIMDSLTVTCARPNASAACRN
jgi:CheY-like chemotaxis protein